jgi:ribosomal-protein-alanine N-acetyltransferase
MSWKQTKPDTMLAFKLRTYRTGDYPGITALWTATDLGRPERGDDEATIERTLAMGGEMLIMFDADNNDKIIGTSWLTFDGRRLLLHHFGILPEYQGRGLSHLLLKETLRIVREKGYQVKLEVHSANKVAVKLYREAGFEYLGDYDVYIIRDIQSIEI